MSAPRVLAASDQRVTPWKNGLGAGEALSAGPDGDLAIAAHRDRVARVLVVELECRP